MEKSISVLFYSEKVENCYTEKIWWKKIEVEELEENPEGADQGFIASYFPWLLDKPLFHPPSNGTKLDGTYRLPLCYQMDASYYCK
ncbi:glycogenin glucosyltransferase [Trifolium repens]|nr:glycogenin glucosyltransferase [Trifolium repens]